MRLEQLYSLTEDETAMLWGIVNLATPPVINAYQMEVELFTAIKDEKLKQRVNQFDKYVKPEYIELYNSLKAKLGY
jgi:hypothetical protein